VARSISYNNRENVGCAAIKLKGINGAPSNDNSIFSMITYNWYAGEVEQARAATVAANRDIAWEACLICVSW
jgi:hypothetical protein